MNEKELYLKALHKWGIERQFYILIEECSEVQKAVTKILRSEKLDKEHVNELFTEIVDLEIMLDKMKVYFDMNKDIKKLMKQHKKEKLELIRRKLKDE
jgi:NTP pyrophosphatase (non-canonical NTP hydrolase)